MGRLVISCRSRHDELRSITFYEAPHDITHRYAGPWQMVLMPAANSVPSPCTKPRSTAL
jgi:hypothetical protein